MKTELATTTDQKGIVEYDKAQLDLVRRTCAPKASDDEFAMFMDIVRRTGLNPLTGEVWCVKYDAKNPQDKQKPAQIFVGKDGYVKRASSFDVYDGYDDGYYDDKGDEFTAPIPSKKIIGAWCKVYRKDRSKPTQSYVLLSEYDQHQSLWNKKKFWLIKKVAIAQAHRAAFLSDFSGTYDESEQWKDERIVDTISMEPEQVSSVGIVEPKDTEPEQKEKNLDDVASDDDVSKFWNLIKKDKLMDFIPDHIKSLVEPELVTKKELNGFYSEAKKAAAELLK